MRKSSAVEKDNSKIEIDVARLALSRPINVILIISASVVHYNAMNAKK